MVVYYVFMEVDEYAGVRGIYLNRERAIECAKKNMYDNFNEWRKEGSEEVIPLVKETVMLEGKFVYKTEYIGDEARFCNISVWEEEIKE